MTRRSVRKATRAFLFMANKSFLAQNSSSQRGHFLKQPASFSGSSQESCRIGIETAFDHQSRIKHRIRPAAEEIVETHGFGKGIRRPSWPNVRIQRHELIKRETLRGRQDSRGRTRWVERKPSRGDLITSLLPFVFEIGTGLSLITLASNRLRRQAWDACIPM